MGYFWQRVPIDPKKLYSYNFLFLRVQAASSGSDINVLAYISYNCYVISNSACRQQCFFYLI